MNTNIPLREVMGATKQRSPGGSSVVEVKHLSNDKKKSSGFGDLKCLFSELTECTDLFLWSFCHYGDHDISTMLVVRFCSCEGVNEKRKWRIKREVSKKGGGEKREKRWMEKRERVVFWAERTFFWRLWMPSLHCCMLPGQLQHAWLRLPPQC